jgi:hypothetical protein
VSIGEKTRDEGDAKLALPWGFETAAVSLSRKTNE